MFHPASRLQLARGSEGCDLPGRASAPWHHGERRMTWLARVRHNSDLETLEHVPGRASGFLVTRVRGSEAWISTFSSSVQAWPERVSPRPCAAPACVRRDRDAATQSRRGLGMPASTRSVRATPPFCRRSALGTSRSRPHRAGIPDMQIRGDDGGRIDFSSYDSGLGELAWIVESGLCSVNCGNHQRQHNVKLLCPAVPASLARDDEKSAFSSGRSPARRG